MQIRNILAIGVSCITAIFLIGCGNSDNSSSATSGLSSNSSTQEASSSVNSTQNKITVVDGYIIQSVVKNSNNQIIGTTDGRGQVILQENDLIYPLYAVGGYIDVNSNQRVDDQDIQLPSFIELSTDKGFVISPLTTLVVMGANKEKLAALAGLSNTDKIYTDPLIHNDIMLEKLNQIVYVLLVSGKINSFIYYVNNLGSGDLPVFGDIQQSSPTTIEGSLNAFAQLAYKAVNNNQTALDAIEMIVNINVSNAVAIENEIKSLKVSITPLTTTGGEINNAIGGGGSGVVTSVGTVVNSSVSFSSSQSSTISNDNALPDLNNHSNIIQSSSSLPSDLPNLVNTSSSSFTSSSSSSNSSNSVNNNSGTGEVPVFKY